MIISASRRTDIPAHYARWFMNRIRSGHCTVPNPFNPKQVARVSLLPDDTDAIVFWSRNPRPLFRFLPELDRRGYHYYFQYTLMDNPRLIDAGVPGREASLKTFLELSRRVGPERVIWRYDPILFSNLTGTRFHREAFGCLAKALQGSTHRCVISIADSYSRADERLRALRREGVEATSWSSLPDGEFAELMCALARTAAACGMEISSCAETIDLIPYGIRPGSCIDDVYIGKTFGIGVTGKKDPSQRKACGCVISKDIGMYDTCIFACAYCYATTSDKRARANHSRHDPESPSLIG